MPYRPTIIQLDRPREMPRRPVKSILVPVVITVMAACVIYLLQ